MPDSPAMAASTHRGATRSTAWPLAAAWTALVVYASLYPFSGWRSIGVPWWTFISAPFSHYWTWFDTLGNVLGYMPLGFLLAVGCLRNGGNWQRRWAVALAWVAGSVLSFAMETTQVWLPGRIASNLDWILNSTGTLSGAVLAWCLQRMGVIGHWSSFRARWLVPDARGALVLLVLWPLALLYPTQVPFGLGHVLERLENQLSDWLAGTPFAEWLPIRAIEFQPILPAMEWAAVALGLLVPQLLAFGVVRARWQRVLLLVVCLTGGVCMTALTAALTQGAQLAWVWLWAPAQGGILAAALLAVPCLWLPGRVCQTLALILLLVHWHIVNHAGTSVYYEWALDRWRDGGFIHFYGLTQWVAWLWPYAVLVYLTQHLVMPQVPANGKTTMPP